MRIISSGGSSGVAANAAAMVSSSLSPPENGGTFGSPNNVISNSHDTRTLSFPTVHISVRVMSVSDADTVPDRGRTGACVEPTTSQKARSGDVVVVVAIVKGFPISTKIGGAPAVG